MRAYFPLATPEGQVRYIVNNPDDNGTSPVPGIWPDGTNEVTRGCPNCVFTVANDSYTGTDPPGAWIAQKLQEYQTQYGHLTITVYSP